MSQETSSTQVLAELAQDLLKEKKNSRRWNIFFKLIWLLLGLLFLSFLFKTEKPLSNHIAVIRLNGAISLEAKTSDRLIAALDQVRKSGKSKAVIIRANSPGGSPVQSDLAYQAILRFKEKTKIPVYVVVEEMCASGCYYIAAAADKIYAAPASMLGSIGVIGGGFGLEEVIKKFGIERRIVTAGKNKSMGDPFLPVKPEHALIHKDLVDKIHRQFIRAVEKGRGKALRKDTPALYSGRVWLGEDALSIGLIDGISNIKDLAYSIDKDAELLDITREDDFLAKVSRAAGTQIASSVAEFWLGLGYATK